MVPYDTRETEKHIGTVEVKASIASSTINRSLLKTSALTSFVTVRTDDLDDLIPMNHLLKVLFQIVVKIGTSVCVSAGETGVILILILYVPPVLKDEVYNDVLIVFVNYSGLDHCPEPDIPSFASEEEHTDLKYKPPFGIPLKVT